MVPARANLPLAVAGLVSVKPVPTVPPAFPTAQNCSGGGNKNIGGNNGGGNGGNKRKGASQGRNKASSSSASTSSGGDCPGSLQECIDIACVPLESNGDYGICVNTCGKRCGGK